MIIRETFKLIDSITPSVQATKEFGGIIESIMSRLLGNLHQSRTLAAQRDALLPKLVSGEIRSRDPFTDDPEFEEVTEGEEVERKERLKTRWA